MIPWFIVHAIDFIVGIFGRGTYVRATTGNRWGAERIYLQPRIPGEPRPRRIGPYLGGPIEDAGEGWTS